MPSSLSRGPHAATAAEKWEILTVVLMTINTDMKLRQTRWKKCSYISFIAETNPLKVSVFTCSYHKAGVIIWPFCNNTVITLCPLMRKWKTKTYQTSADLWVWLNVVDRYPEIRSKIKTLNSLGVFSPHPRKEKTDLAFSCTNTKSHTHTRHTHSSSSHTSARRRLRGMKAVFACTECVSNEQTCVCAPSCLRVECVRCLSLLLCLSFFF